MAYLVTYLKQRCTLCDIKIYTLTGNDFSAISDCYREHVNVAKQRMQHSGEEWDKKFDHGVAQLFSWMCYSVLNVPTHDAANELFEYILRGKASTAGIGRGIACAHIRHPHIDDANAIIVHLTEDTIDFDALDDEKLSLFLMYFVPPHKWGDGRRIVERYGSILQNVRPPVSQSTIADNIKTAFKLNEPFLTCMSPI